MNSTQEITHAGLNDLSALVPLFDAYRRFYTQSQDLAAAEEFLRARMEQDESVIFLAWRDGEAVGFTQLYPTFSSVSLRRAWILNDLYVAESARGLGVGASLLQRAAQHAKETQAKGLALETASDNLAAQALYEKLGWKKDEEFFRYGLLV